MGMLYYVHADEGDVRESDGFRAREIKLPTKSSNLAEITLDKRYPKQGRALNEDVEMTVYVLEGSVRFSRWHEGVRRRINDLRPEEAAILLGTCRRSAISRLQHPALDPRTA